MPLTLEELKSIPNTTVYLEYRYPEYNSGYRGRRWVLAYLAYSKSPNRLLYGKTWRCWLRKPTEEETQSADWMED